MKSLKTLLLTKSVGAALIAVGGIAAPAISHASPDDGVACRAGYTGTLVGSRFKCVKEDATRIALECTSLTLRTYVSRAAGAPGDTSGGRDICTRNGINVGSTDSLTGLVLGQDYVFAAANPTTVEARVRLRDQQEATSLGLPISLVDTQHGQPAVRLNGGIGVTDVAAIQLKYFTFPIQ